MTERSPVTKTVSFETVVDTLPEAWAFIMDKIEDVGPDPSVHIHPATNQPPPIMQALMAPGTFLDEPLRKFHIVIEGTITESAKEDANL